MIEEKKIGRSTYFDNEEILNEYNKLGEFIIKNDDYIYCADYSKTLDYILFANTNEEQVERFVIQLIDGYNSIDTDFTDDINYLTGKNYEEDNIQEKDKEHYIIDILKHITFATFQSLIIETCLDYYEVSVSEYKEELYEGIK